MSCIIVNEHPTADGKKIIEILLNAERSLNALTLEMIDSIQPLLERSREDEQVAAIILDGMGEKAFCAGGDVVSLYKSMTGAGGDSSLPEQFFTREYTLDYTIHTYPKPIICWASGIVMGGGMGLMNGCTHRVVTETSHLAMPEVTIGLYPDVGGSWFLNHMPGRCGLFLGLTGNPMNAEDAIFLGLADRFVAQEQRPDMLENLKQADWSKPAEQVVSEVLRELERASRSTHAINSKVKEHYELIQQITDESSLQAVVDNLMAVETEDKWLQRGQKIISKDSPLSMCLIQQQLKHCRHMSLREVFMAELVLSVQCCQHREFPEGVRALLVDKDGQPDWMYKKLADVEPDIIDGFFVSPWETNPLTNII